MSGELQTSSVGAGTAVDRNVLKYDGFQSRDCIALPESRIVASKSVWPVSGLREHVEVRT